jgi:hypothetical protein
MKSFSYLRALVLCATGVGVFIACATSGSGDGPSASGMPSSSASGSSSGSMLPFDASRDEDVRGAGESFLEIHGVMHMHSPYSHDACDGQGLSAGVPNPSCLADLRAAPCKDGLDFIALTDHPEHMNEVTPTENVLYNAAAGDTLLKDSSGAVIGNLLKCADGHTVLLTYGFEGDHTLPIAFAKHPTRYDGYVSSRPIAEVQSLVADLHASGALVALAHSEADDITAATIVNGGADAMEWYNPHGNFKTALGGDKITGAAADLIPFFNKLGDFLQGSTSGAHPDLFYLLLLPSWPQKGFDKWREVQKSRFVPGVFGSDVHQNVSVDPVCKGAVAQAACRALIGNKPNVLAQLISGGQMTMSDGRRFDAFERLLRWLHNRVFVKSLSPEDLKEALGHGRSYGLFSVFGDPKGFVYTGAAAGKTAYLGDAIPMSSGPLTLTVQLPAQPSPIPGGVTFDAASAATAEVRAVLYRTDKNGTSEVGQAKGLGQVLSKTVSEPGQYHVEVWLKPRHLASKLGGQAAIADTEYMWLITNPIRITP